MKAKPKIKTAKLEDKHEKAKKTMGDVFRKLLNRASIRGR